MSPHVLCPPAVLGLLERRQEVGWGSEVGVLILTSNLGASQKAEDILLPKPQHLLAVLSVHLPFQVSLQLTPVLWGPYQSAAQPLLNTTGRAYLCL